MSLSHDQLHASCVEISGKAILITGLSGSGKSDLSLRLIDRGAVLISDDQTMLRREKGQIWASAPDSLRGKMEVRGLGVCDFKFSETAPVALIVELSTVVERFPMDRAKRKVLDIEFDVIKIDAMQASAPIKLEIALANVQSSQP